MESLINGLAGFQQFKRSVIGEEVEQGTPVYRG